MEIEFNIVGCSQKKHISHFIASIADDSPVAQQLVGTSVTSEQYQLVIKGAQRLLNTNLIGSVEDSDMVFAAISFNDTTPDPEFIFEYKDSDNPDGFAFNLSFYSIGYQNHISIAATFAGKCRNVDKDLLSTVTSSTIGHYRDFYSSKDQITNANFFDTELPGGFVSALTADIAYTVH